MIHPDLQPTLFKTPVEEALKSARVTKPNAVLWFVNGLLSYDVCKKDELDHSEMLEMYFMSYLFRTSHSFLMIKHYLLKLKKPYAYNPTRIYYDVFNEEWFYKPVDLNVVDVISVYLERLSLNNSSYGDALDLVRCKN